MLIIDFIFFTRRCQLSGELDNASYYLPYEIMNKSYPYDIKTGNFSTCTLYEYDTNFMDAKYNNYSNTTTKRIRHCNKWIYDKSEFQNTVVTEVRIKKFTRVIPWLSLREGFCTFFFSSIWCATKLGTRVHRTLC